jgi:type I restriction enzyme S subunit
VDCPHSTPKWALTGKICLRTTNLLPNRLNLSEVRYVSESIYNNRIERLKPQIGDILYSREGGILGIACILDIDEDVCLGQRMMMFRLNSNVNNKFICYFLNSPFILEHVNNLIGGSAAPHINVGDIKEYPIPFPAPEEQNEIVRRIEMLFALVDKIETRYENTKAILDRLPQAILAIAFRGELIPQNPNDEPASVLLERIRAERESTKIKHK